MQIEKITKKIEGEYKLDAFIYSPKEDGKYPAILMCHGFLSAKDELGELPEKISEQGYIVLTFDFTGHGKSEGDRGYFRSISHLDDTERALKTLFEFEKTDTERVAIVGHSMGTVATTRVLGETELGKKCKTAVLMAPVRKFTDSVKGLELQAYKAVSNIAWPILLLTGKHIYLPYKFTTKDIFKDQEVAKKAKAGGFLQTSMSVNNYHYMINQVDNEKFASKVNIPTMIMVAKNDPMVPNKGSKAVYDSIRTVDKKYIVIDNSGHSMMMDSNKEEVEKQLLDWFKEKL